MDLLHHKIIGSGPPLVFLHGLFGMLDNWHGIAKKMSDRYTCILIDQRNHGRSFHSDAMTFQLMAEDVQKVLDNNWIHETSILGHSMGGKTAMQLALDYPDLVTKLIVVDIAPVDYPPSHQLEFKAMTNLNPQAHQTRSSLRNDLLSKLDPTTTDFLLKSVERHGQGFRWRLGLQELLQNYEHLTVSPIQQFGPYDGPTLFIKGGQSAYIQQKHQPAVDALFGNAQVVEITKANHWVHVDAPMELVRLVDRFLQD